MNDHLDHPRIDAEMTIGIDLASGPDETVETVVEAVERPGCVVQVWMEEDKDRPDGKPWPFRLIETEFPDLATFLEFVDADRLISGDWLFTHWSREERYVRVVHSRKAVAFRGAEVRKAQLPDFRLVEGGGA